MLNARRSVLVGSLVSALLCPLGCGGAHPEAANASAPAGSASATSAGTSPSAMTPAVEATKRPTGPRNPKVCAALSRASARASERTTNPTKPASFTKGPCALAAKAFEAAVQKALPKKTDAALADATRGLFACEAPWATALSSVKVKDGALTARLTIDYLDDSGKPLMHGDAVLERDEKKPNLRLKLGDHVDALADFIAAKPSDGAATVGITLLSVDHEGPRVLRGELWHGPIASGAASAPGTFIENDPNAAGLGATGFADVDGDGRLDVLYGAPFSASVVGDDGADHQVDGPTFVAHALADGTFSSSDAVAKDAASCACPERPNFDALGADGDLVGAIACARVWNLDAKAAVEALCAKASGAPAMCKQSSVRKLVDTSAKVALP
jgi:hypothetical protein